MTGYCHHKKGKNQRNKNLMMGSQLRTIVSPNMTDVRRACHSGNRRAVFLFLEELLDLTHGGLHVQGFHVVPVFLQE